MDLQLETDRLLLRELKHSDAEAMFAMDSNPNVHKYLWNKPTQSIEETVKIIELVRNQYTANNIGRFATILKETGEFIGWSGIKWVTQPENGRVNFYDFGYRLDERFWGKGYASEASFAWLDYGFNTMKIETMCASAHTANAASNRILQKIGMELKSNYIEDDVLWSWYEMQNPNLQTDSLK